MQFLKKIIAIALLLVLLFNIAGYRLLYIVIGQNQSAVLSTKLDNNNYGNGEIITITLPLALPYQTDWKDFERADGEINFEGKTYHYTKRKIENGNLVLQCIVDTKKMQLQTAKDNYTNSVSDISKNNPTSQKQNATTNFIKLFSTDCVENNMNNLFAFINAKENRFNLLPNLTLSKGLRATPEQPPEA